LTEAGRKEFSIYDRMSDDYVRQILVQLPDQEFEELVECMRRITGILEGVKF
jgi:DNA-binding MarR family transcriptional regulator